MASERNWEEGAVDNEVESEIDAESDPTLAKLQAATVLLLRVNTGPTEISEIETPSSYSTTSTPTSGARYINSRSTPMSVP